MIPISIALEGFLSYEQKQVIPFHGASLWLLSGPNGSGKSSVFDGISFCLFGGHRGGKDEYHELINKKCDRATVEFEFLLDGHQHRIRRTLNRNKKGGATSTQQVFQLLTAENGQVRDEWQAVPDTSKRVDFDKWVQEHIGLNYDTFTASVLLVQGKAENLLMSDPRKRHEMLARILGMERFERLHARAVAQRNALEAQAKVLENQVEGLTEVTPAELEAAGLAIQDGETKLLQAQSQVEHLQGLEALAQRWTELRNSLGKIARQLAQVKGLLAEADDIERAWSRWQELRDVMVPLGRYLDQGDRLAVSAQLLEKLQVRQHDLEAQGLLLAQALVQVGQKRQQLEMDLDTGEQHLQQLMADLQGLTLALPQLRTLHREREHLRQAHAEAGRASAARDQALAMLQRQEEALAPLAGQLAEAIQIRQQADHQVTREQAFLDEVQNRLKRFHSVVGEKLCRYCGQALSAEHVKEEQAKLQKELSQCQASHRQVLERQAALRQAESQVEKEHQATIRLRDQARQQMADGELRHEKALDAGRRHQEACSAAYEELTEPFRSQISRTRPTDWLATLFPAKENLDALHEQQARLKTEAATLEKTRQADRKQLETYLKEEKRLSQEQKTLQNLFEEAAKDAAVQETLRKSFQEAQALILRELPAEWQTRARSATRADLVQWQEEFRQLQQQGAQARYQELVRSRLALESLLPQQKDLERQHEAIPEEARRPPEQIDRLLSEARRTQKACTDELLQARNAHQRLLDRQEERRRLAEERGSALTKLHHNTVLAKYLDRDWLQRHLMRQAEQAIVAYARDILDRLSGGQICLQQRGDSGTGGDKALVMEAFNRTAANQNPHRVEMLSGSERFRVAVSLALAIGQYASRQHRPIQSVIIDEGFGCLDQANRHLMIQELLNLQGQLHKILLVSHQEEFAEAFQNGYRFEIDNGSTQVKRFPG